MTYEKYKHLQGFSDFFYWQFDIKGGSAKIRFVYSVHLVHHEQENYLLKISTFNPYDFGGGGGQIFKGGQLPPFAPTPNANPDNNNFHTPLTSICVLK